MVITFANEQWMCLPWLSLDQSFCKNSPESLLPPASLATKKKKWIPLLQRCKVRLVPLSFFFLRKSFFPEENRQGRRKNNIMNPLLAEIASFNKGTLAPTTTTVRYATAIVGTHFYFFSFLFGFFFYYFSFIYTICLFYCYLLLLFTIFTF